MMSSLLHNYIIDDDNRVVLQPIEGYEHDFINASYVDVSVAGDSYRLRIRVCYSLIGLQLRKEVHCLSR